MNLHMREVQNSSELNLPTYDFGFVGNAIDDRTRESIAFIGSVSKEVLQIEYSAENFEIQINGVTCDAEDLTDKLEFRKGKSFIIESTSTGFVEIYLLCKAFKERGIENFDVLYVEPLSYKNMERSQLLHRRVFELSDEFPPNYIGIPGATILLSDHQQQRGVFFLGYEERRLDRALEDYPMIKSGKCSVVFGVPAFKPGWEMDAFANNIRIIRDKNIRGGILYCGAENPKATVSLLQDVHQSLQTGEKLFIAPIGTKPNGVGVALFTALTPEIGLLYDHPIKSKKRTLKVSNWHLYQVQKYK
jgi:hypothetical protein